MIKITKQLRKYFILISLISMLLIAFISNIGMNYILSDYIKYYREYRDLEVVRFVENLFESGEIVRNSSLMNILQLARMNDMEIKIIDNNENIIFNTEGLHRGRGHNTGYYNQIKNIEYNIYPIIINDTEVGKAAVGRSSDLYATDYDKRFIYSVNGIYAVAFAFSIFIAIVVSLYVSKKFLKPLLIIKENVIKIKEEKYDSLLRIDTKTFELHDLYNSMIDLSTRLKNHEALRKRLTSDVAHELRTPLATLQNYLEALMDGVWEPTQERLSGCYDEVLRLTKLIKDLSDLSGFENNNIQLIKKQINFSELLNTLANNLLPMVINKNISIVKDIHPNIFIYGDQDRINQIFINLISNSYKYTNPNGWIKITLRSNKINVIATVEDNGQGISEKDLPFIFERFYRGENSRNRDTGGTGIGLTIAKALVEAHNGTVNIDSIEGKGTKVIIVLGINNIN